MIILNKLIKIMMDEYHYYKSKIKCANFYRNNKY